MELMRKRQPQLRACKNIIRLLWRSHIYRDLMDRARATTTNVMSLTRLAGGTYQLSHDRVRL